MKIFDNVRKNLTDAYNKSLNRIFKMLHFVSHFENRLAQSFILLPLRSICRLLPLEAVWVVAGLFGGFRYLIAGVQKVLDALNLKRVADRLPFGMYKGYDFHYLHTNTFDHLATPVIHFFQREELENWMLSARISHYELLERHPGTAAASWLIESPKETI